MLIGMHGMACAIGKAPARHQAVWLLALWLGASGGSGTVFAEGDPAGDWLQWRGNTRDSVAPGPGWPDGLTTDRLEKRWRQPLGPGYSGPIVAGKRVFVTETRDKRTEHVHAFDRDSGEPLWETSWTGAMQVVFIGASAGSWIRSTPSCDGTRLVVLGMRDVLVCLDVATGSTLWRVDFPATFGSPVPDFGGVSSPLVAGDGVYVQAASGVVKLDAQTGEVRWRVPAEGGGKSLNGAFSSPVLATLCGEPHLVVQGREVLAGLSPTTGATLWKTPVRTLFGMNIVTPTVRGNAVFVSSLGGSFLFGIDTNAPAAAAAAAEGEAASGAVDYGVKVMWKNPLQAEMSSPVLIDEHIYVHLRDGRMACLDWASGARTWITEPLGSYWSLATQARRILALSDSGELRLIAATPDAFTLLGEARVSNAETWAHLAVSGDLLFVRDLKGLTAYRWR